MGMLKIDICCCSAEKLVVLIILLALPAQRCERVLLQDEPDYIRVPAHPEIDENSPIDSEPFKPHKVPKPTVPAVVANCILKFLVECGEHDYNGTRIAEMECGQRPWLFEATSPELGVNKLVVNGTFTDKNQFPWVVALVERRSNGSAIHFCGGTLISNKLVLTALHCFTTRAINATEVWLNEKNLTLLSPNTLKIQAKRLIVHPNYNPIMSYNDIALVELTEAVDVQRSYLRPICLPHDESFDKKLYAYTAGWGQIKYNGPKSVALQHTCLPLLNHNECTVNTLGYYKARVTEWMICAGDIQNGGRDACPGDSGGPLLVEGETDAGNRYYVVGIVSWGDQCALPRRPGVYTRVSKYLAWIHQEARNLPDNKFCV